jgi:hypothetical protein
MGKVEGTSPRHTSMGEKETDLQELGRDSHPELEPVLDVASEDTWSETARTCDRTAPLSWVKLE